jgi:hypothetical protein
MAILITDICLCCVTFTIISYRMWGEVFVDLRIQFLLVIVVMMVLRMFILREHIKLLLILAVNHLLDPSSIILVNQIRLMLLKPFLLFP